MDTTPIEQAEAVAPSKVIVQRLADLKERTIMRYGLHPDADDIQNALDYIQGLEDQVQDLAPKPTVATKGAK